MTSFYGGGAASTSGGGSTPTPIKGALIFKGTLGISDDGATVLVLPDEHEEGWTYLVVTAGTYAGQLCEKGDFIICVSSGEAASDLDWTVVQGNTFNTLPTPTALDEGKIISVDTSGNYVLIDNPSSGETENLPDPSEADEGKILSVGADGNYILTDNPAEDKLDKANPTYTGSLTGENATFTGSVQVSTPDQDNEAANKSYVDTALADAKNYTDSEITNFENGTTELPYVKDSGDTVTGTYNFTGANVTIAEPIVSNNPATKNYVDTKIASAGGSGEVVSYTQGNGINISPENVISVVIAADNANGLAVDTNGIKLNVATPTTAGAMSGTDKAKLDATSTTEQMNQAISNAIDETLEDPTKLPFVNINGDTMHGSLTTTELFTDFVTIRNAGTDGNTGFQNNSDTDHIRVYDKIADTLVPIEVGEPVNNQDASTKKYVDDKVTTETATRTEAIESLDEAKADKDNPTFTGIISGANATLSGTLTGNTATFSGGITVPLEPGAEGSATSKKYVDDQIAAIDIGPLTQRVATAEGEIDTLQSDIINITNGTTELPYIPSDGGTISGPINWGGNPQEATELANKAYVDANDSDAVNSAKEYTNAQIEIAKGYTDEAVTNLTNGTTKLPYVTKEEVEIAADTRDVARAYRYTFNDGLDGTNSNAGFGFIDFTPAIVTEKDGSTSFSPLYIGEPEKDSHAATKKYVDDKAGNYLPLAGGTMTGSINAGKNTVTNLKEPEEGTDATTKNYVDGEVAKAAPVSIMPIPEVEGQNLITVSDSVEWPLQGLKIFGKSTQKTTTGTQLIDTQAWQTADSEYYKVAEDGGMIQLKGDGRDQGSVPVFLELEAGDYTASINPGFILQIIKDGTDLAVPGPSNNYKVSFTLDSPATIGMKVQESPTTNNFPSPVAYPMINAGSTAKPWEPYTGGKPSPSPEYPQAIVNAGGDTGSIGLTVSNSADQSQSLTISTPNGLPGIPVDSGGNYTDAEGQQWVCDEIDCKNEAYIKNLTLIPDLSIGTFTKHGNGMFICDVSAFSAPRGNSKILSRCTHFPSVDNQSYYGILVSLNYVIIGAALAETFDNVDDFNNFLLEQRENNTPVQLLYYQNESIETPLSEDEIAAYRSLHTYDGTTIISTDENISGLKVKYVAKAIDYQQSINAAIQETNDKIDAVYNSLVKKAETVDEVNQLFKDWWNANWEEGSSTYNDMLERWFGKVLDDDKVYGVKLPLFETSTSPQGEYIEDSVGAIVTLATEEDSGQNDFAKTPQFWCVEVAAEKNADGSHTIYACEFIDDINVVRNGGPDNGKHLVWVLQKNTYVREYEESGYSYIKIQCHPADGFVQWPQGTDRTGHTYSYMANPKYAAGIDDEGNIGGRTGLRPTSYMSMNQTIQAWRARGPQYSGSSACFYKWAYIMFALLTAKKGEDVGCNNYNLQYAAAVSESGVSRIILTADQANNLYVGSNVIVGDTEGNNDRGQAAMYSLVNQKRISSIEEVTIEEDASSYKAVYIDVPEGTTFNTTAGTTYISTMPYYSGWTDTVKGTIGTRYGTNLNKQPYLLQKVELMNGAYNYASDELDQWSQQNETHYLYSYYLCEDQTKVSTNGTITDDYVKKENAIITIDTSVYTTNNSWYYIEDNLADNNFKMLNPKKFSTSAGSGTGTRDAFYLSYAASEVRMPIVWAHLAFGRVAGLSCRNSYASPSWAGWHFAGGCPGLSG